MAFSVRLKYLNMNPVNNLNLDFLIGKRLQQVCLGVNEIILNFYPETAITVYNKAELIVKQNHYEWVSEKKQDKYFPVQLILEEQISKVDKIPNNNLKLNFANKIELILFDEFSSFESVTINHNGDVYVI
jgi:hypothetical protein